MSTGGITAWARREEAIHGEIKETKSSSVNLKEKNRGISHARDAHPAGQMSTHTHFGT